MNALAEKFTSRLARLASMGKGSGDPIANPRATTQWLDSLPIGDAYKCQEAIVQQLKRFNEREEILTRDHLAVLLLLDERSRDLQDTLVRQYLRNPRMSRQLENQLWHAVYGLYWEIAQGYQAAVLQLAPAPAKSSELARLTLRALRAVGQLLKWRAVRYLPAGDKLWLRLHSLYEAAENGGFAHEPLRAYADDAAPSTCEAEYLHTLLLNLANSGTLYPRQLDLLDRWLQAWNGLTHLSPRFDADVHGFAVDLAADHGPRRVRKPDSDRPVRFWGTAAVLEKVDALGAALRAGQTPLDLGLGELARTAESLDLLGHLQAQWAPWAKREQRRAVREPVKRLIDIAHGLDAIVAQIKDLNTPAAVSPYGSNLSYGETDDVLVYGFVTERTRERLAQEKKAATPAPSVERWVMHDASACGYGALVETRDLDWLRVGSLLGVKGTDAERWQLGVVRRLSRETDDTTSVGIETLPQAPELAMLYDTTPSSYTVNGLDNSGAHLPHAGLWLPAVDGPDSVIIDPVHFAPGKVFRVHGVENVRYIAVGKPIERSEGWMRVVAEPVEG